MMIPSVAAAAAAYRSSFPPPFAATPAQRHVHPKPTASRCACRRSGGGGPSWDSNAEWVPPGRFSFQEKRRWWSDDASDELDGDFDEMVDDDEVENIWDRIWIFKVFRSYGYLLPAIIASMLLATGPKAFLMALALPLGQSVLSLAFEKLWGNARERSRTKPKTEKQQPFARSATDFRRQHREDSTAENKGGKGYQSWVSADAGVANKGSASSNTTFGGWDELDRQGSSSRASMRRRPPNRPSWAGPMSKSTGKVSRMGRYRDAPLFFRLLVAIFPFLGSWTKIL